MPGELLVQVIYSKGGEEMITNVRQAVTNIGEAQRKLQLIAERWAIVGTPIYSEGKRQHKLEIPGGSG